MLLYDVAHDREFIAFQDIHMQVQTSPKGYELGFERLSTSQLTWPMGQMKLI